MTNKTVTDTFSLLFNIKVTTSNIDVYKKDTIIGI